MQGGVLSNMVFRCSVCAAPLSQKSGKRWDRFQFNSTRYVCDLGMQDATPASGCCWLLSAKLEAPRVPDRNSEVSSLAVAAECLAAGVKGIMVNWCPGSMIAAQLPWCKQVLCKILPPLLLLLLLLLLLPLLLPQQLGSSLVACG